MWTAGGDGAGFGGPGGAGDVTALAQQYWRALGEAMRSAGGAQPAQQDPWQAAMAQWSHLAGGAQRTDAGDMIERFSAQARHWFSTMQQVAGQFAGQQASAGDIANAWKQAMGGGGNPFAALFAGIGGGGQPGFEQWYRQAAPMLQGWWSGMPGGSPGGMFAGMSGGMGGAHAFEDLRQRGLEWLRMPAFGLHREQQERWQALAAAHIGLQQANEGYNALLLDVGRDAFERFEHKLAERGEPGRQLKSARALFDLWIDAAEEAYAKVALSEDFRAAYGALVNAQMRVRAGVQREVELIGDQFGMPGRTEMDAAHRRLAELEREVRRLRSAAAGPSQGAARPGPRAAASAAEAKQASAPRAAAPPAPPPADATPADATRSKNPPARRAPANTRVARPSAAKKAAKTPARASTDARASSKTAARSTTASRGKPVATPTTAPSARAAAKRSRAAAPPSSRRGARPAIAAIAMPARPQPMPAGGNTKSVKRSR